MKSYQDPTKNRWNPDIPRTSPRQWRLGPLLPGSGFREAAPLGSWRRPGVFSCENPWQNGTVENPWGNVMWMGTYRKRPWKLLNNEGFNGTMWVLTFINGDVINGILLIGICAAIYCITNHHHKLQNAKKSWRPGDIMTWQQNPMATRLLFK